MTKAAKETMFHVKHWWLRLMNLDQSQLRTCPDCHVEMNETEYTAHFDICVYEPRVTLKWLDDYRFPKEPKPREFPRLRKVALILCPSLIVVDVAMLVLWWTIPVWWQK